MALHTASRAASSWFRMSGGMMPGLSSSSKEVSLLAVPSAAALDSLAFAPRSPLTRIHCRLRVIPGASADLARRRPTSRLITADLPTLGNPMTPTRSDRALRPRDRRFSFTCDPAFRMERRSAAMPFPCLASTGHTTLTDSISAPAYLARSSSPIRARLMASPSSESSCRPHPRASYAAIHPRREDAVARSVRVSATTRGRPADHSATRGCDVAAGMRQSRPSTTTSTRFSVAARLAVAAAMWPGYQLMVGRRYPPDRTSSGSTSTSASADVPAEDIYFLFRLRDF